MLIKSSAIDRLLRENPNLKDRRFGLPAIGKRNDGEQFNPTVQDIADAINIYGFEVRDSEIVNKPDIDLDGGNPMKYEPFPLSIKEMIKSLSNTDLYKYPYTEGDDNIRKVLLEYIEQEGFINTEPYDYEDIDDKSLSIHNITFLPSTSITFNIIINIIAKPGDVILVPGPSYGLYIIRVERTGAEVEIIPLEKERLINSFHLMNNSLQKIVAENEYEVRLNTYEDQAQMAKIKVDGWCDAYQGIIAQDYLDNLDYELQTKRYQDSFAEYKDYVLVAINKETNELLGYSCFDENEKDGYDSELVSLYIKSEYKDMGIGTLLFEETIKYLKENLILWCLKENDKAINFYKKLDGKIEKEKLAKIGNNFYEEY